MMGFKDPIINNGCAVAIYNDIVEKVYLCCTLMENDLYNNGKKLDFVENKLRDYTTTILKTSSMA